MSPYHRFGRHPVVYTRHRLKKRNSKRQKSPNFKSVRPRDINLRIWVSQSPKKVLNPKLLELLGFEQHNPGSGYPNTKPMKTPRQFSLRDKEEKKYEIK